MSYWWARGSAVLFRAHWPLHWPLTPSPFPCFIVRGRGKRKRSRRKGGWGSWPLASCAQILPPPQPHSSRPNTPFCLHTHSTLCRSMTVSCGFSEPAVTCVLLIYRHYSRQANPESPSLGRQPGSSPEEVLSPSAPGGAHAKSSNWTGLSGSTLAEHQSTVFIVECVSTYVTENTFNAAPPLPHIYDPSSSTLCMLFSPSALCRTCNGDNECDTLALTNTFTVASDFQRQWFHFYG